MKKKNALAALLVSALALAPVVSTLPAGQTAKAAETDVFVSYWSNEPGVTEMPVADGARETYAEEDRQWQGLPTIAVTPGGRMWCAWQTGDSVEGSDGPNNYDVMYYSDDMGKTWSEEYMIWDVPDASVRIADPRLFYDQFGKLWLVLIRGGLKGAYAIELINPDCDNPSENLQTGEPISWMKAPPAHRPTILSNGRWVTPVEVDADAQQTYICNPDDERGKYAWTTNTSQPAATAFPDQKTYGEAQIIELTDGSLMMLSRLPRTCGGGMEVSYSYDYGTNWTPYEANLGEPYITPSSKFHIQRLESGAILLITHATTEDRKDLAAYLSYDDGKTFPYKMMLDDSEMRGDWRGFGVSYPEAAAEQGENGEIYIVYDAGRYGLKEIRMCVVTEEDIKAGRPVSEYCRMREIISDLGEYIAYVDTEEEYERYYTVEPGTAKADILQNLPETITLIGEDDSRLTLTGTWDCPDYSKNTPGTYTFTFSQEVTGMAQDRYSLLKAYVTVAEEQDEPDDPGGSDSADPDSGEPDSSVSPGDSGGSGSEGCGSAAGGGAIAIVAGAAAAVCIRRKKPASRGK